jgi:hypothetical protein
MHDIVNEPKIYVKKLMQKPPSPRSRKLNISAAYLFILSDWSILLEGSSPVGGFDRFVDEQEKDFSERCLLGINCQYTNMV